MDVSDSSLGQSYCHLWRLGELSCPLIAQDSLNTLVINDSSEDCLCWKHKKFTVAHISMGWDSIVGISTRYGLGNLRIEFPVGVRFSSHVQTIPVANQASYTMGAGSFLGVKQPKHNINHPPPASIKVKERVELYLCTPLCLHDRLWGELYLLLNHALLLNCHVCVVQLQLLCIIFLVF